MNTLLVFRLTVQSSYTEESEHEADDEHFDTVQWWLAPGQSWRIKTFAIDSDIHTHHLAGPVAESKARENTEKHYGEVIASSFVLKLADLSDKQQVRKVMEEHGGAVALEVDRNGGRFAFWNPLRIKYSTKSQPQ
jgi:hypothetical protein